MSASEPPEVPSEVEYRRPAWVEPPADVVPGIVPVELILARTPQRAIGLTGVRAYPTGFGCTLHLRLRQDIPGEQSTFGAFNSFGEGVDPAGEFADYFLRFGVGFADGRKATNLDHRRDLTSSRRRTHRRCGWSVGRAMTGWPGGQPVGLWPAAAGAAGLGGRVAGPRDPRVAGRDRRRPGPGAARRAVPIWPDPPRR